MVKVGRARDNSSRAKELGVMLGYCSKPEELLSLMNKHPSGNLATISGVKFEWGLIRRLLNQSASIPILQPIKIKASHVCHLDGILAGRKTAIEKELGLDCGVLRSKADLLLVTKSVDTFLISLKDDSGASKLGQKSGKMMYGKALLEGGLLKELKLPLKPEVGFADTDLTDEQFKKLNKKDRALAAYKKSNPAEWNNYVDEAMLGALQQLRQFGLTLTEDLGSLKAFLLSTLVGLDWLPKNYYVVLGEKVIDLARVLKKIEKAKVTTEIINTENKSSLLVNLKIDGNNYCLTKIEPAFDGAKSNVSQTKGVIYYFQEYSKSPEIKSYKQLLIDLSE